jgi:4-hydroxy-3-methylbut-2-enyl diphosphate reductase
MPVKLAKKVGFCFGVRRAIEMAEAVLSREKRAYSLGSIIHNKQVVDILAKKGLKVIDGINKARGGCIVISSHGISPQKIDQIKSRSLELVDTTCPFVRNAQEMAARLSREGHRVIIVGDADHPEVKALVDFAGKGACVVKDANGIKALNIKPHEKIGILSQTTQAMDNFLPVIKAAIETAPASLRVFNTICRDAEDRQASAKEIAGQTDLMLVVGGKNSANTKRLFDVCKKMLDGSYLVETEKDLKDAWFKGINSVGVTSGASTPDWVVDKVVKRVEAKIKRKGRLQTGKWQKEKRV